VYISGCHERERDEYDEKECERSVDYEQEGWV
jgi:hypothetical protein